MLLKDKVAVITGAASVRGLGSPRQNYMPSRARKWSLLI